MASSVVWTCDACGGKETGFHVNECPRDWYEIKKGGHFNTQVICEACYQRLFKKRR